MAFADMKLRFSWAFLPGDVGLAGLPCLGSGEKIAIS
jgi:hypothetical protein